MDESGDANTAGSLKLHTSAVATFFFSWSSGDTYSLPYGRLPVGRATLSSVRPLASSQLSVLSSQLIPSIPVREFRPLSLDSRVSTENWLPSYLLPSSA